nr:uncharacterized protein LOC115256562 [Aedes albopictus]
MSRELLKRKIADAFEEQTDASGTKTYRCLANLGKCEYAQKTFVPANFKRHIIVCHVEVARRLGILPDNKDNADAPSTSKRPKPSPSKIIIEHDRKSALKGSIMYVTENNLPLCFPDWESSQLLIGPIWKAYGLHVTSNTMPNLVSHAAGIMRRIMREKFQNQLVALKIDSATRLGRSFFAINVSLADEDGEVQIYHLASHEMTERQTKENLQLVIDGEMKEFGLEYKQVLTVTSDNAGDGGKNFQST